MNRTTKQPLISVILPVYNASRYLDQALESIINQSYKRIEIICVDDQSTDNSYAILARFARRRKNVRVYQTLKHSGAAKAANIAISKAKGNYLARMDADDIMLPKRLEQQFTFLESHPDHIAVGGQCKRIDSKGKVLGIKEFPLDHQTISTMIFTAIPLQQPTIMINRKKLPASFNWYNTSLMIGEDYDVYYRLMQHGKLANLPHIVIKYREHSANLTLSSQKRSFWYITQSRILAVTKHGYVPTFSAVLQVIAQTILVLILPDRLLYALHMKTRHLFFNRKPAYT